MPPPAGSIPNTPSWRDKMGKYPQGTLALEGFGSGAGHGVTIVDANTGNALTRIGDPGWDNMQALYDAGYTQFAKDDGSIGSFQEFAQKLSLSAQQIQTQNLEASTGIGGPNTLRNIASGLLMAATPAALAGFAPEIATLAKSFGVSPEIASKVLSAGSSAGGAAIGGGNPLTAGLASLATSFLPTSVAAPGVGIEPPLQFADASTTAIPGGLPELPPGLGSGLQLPSSVNLADMGGGQGLNLNAPVPAADMGGGTGFSLPGAATIGAGALGLGAFAAGDTQAPAPVEERGMPYTPPAGGLGTLGTVAGGAGAAKVL